MAEQGDYDRRGDDLRRPTLAVQRTGPVRVLSNRGQGDGRRRSSTSRLLQVPVGNTGAGSAQQPASTGAFGCRAFVSQHLAGVRGEHE